MIVYLIGFMGAGKSTIGKFAARHTGLLFVDLDTAIEEKKGKSVSQIFTEEGEAAFREIERAMLHEITQTQDQILLSCGGGTPCFFDNMDWMNAHGETVYLDLSAARLSIRLKNARTERPLLQSIQGDLQVWIHKKLLERAAFYGKAKHILTENDANKQQVRDLILRLQSEG